MSAAKELSREELLAVLGELQVALAERDAVIAALLAEVEQLRRRAGMDSSNSSMPPGSDGPAARAKRVKKPKKRSPPPRGGQAGHALAWRSTPDRSPSSPLRTAPAVVRRWPAWRGRSARGCRCSTPRR
ncbi:DUF6444 domain-containing protein [Nonomuraea sp. NPDC002799]